MKNLGVQGVRMLGCLGVGEFGECYPPNGLVDLIDTKSRERNRREHGKMEMDNEIGMRVRVRDEMGKERETRMDG